MKDSLLILWALPLVAACSGGVRVDPSSGASSSDGGPGGAGAGGAGAGGAGPGGAGGAVTGGGTTCDALVADLAAKIAAARACTEVGTWDECDMSATVEDECGCHALLNHLDVPAVSAASAAAAAVVAAGCTSECDFHVCVERYNDPSFRGGCIQQGESPGAGVCAWVGAS